MSYHAHLSYTTCTWNPSSLQNLIGGFALVCVGIFGILSIPCLAIEPIYIVTSSGRFPAVASGNTLPLPGPFTRVLLEPQRRLLASPHHSRREVVVALWPKRRAPAIAGRRRRFVYRPTTEPRDLLGVEPTAFGRKYNRYQVLLYIYRRSIHFFPFGGLSGTNTAGVRGTWISRGSWFNVEATRLKLYTPASQQPSLRNENVN